MLGCRQSLGRSLKAATLKSKNKGSNLHGCNPIDFPYAPEMLTEPKTRFILRGLQLNPGTFVSFLGLLLLAAGALLAQQKSDEQILFLHLRMKDGVITLVKTTTRPGQLKLPRDGQQRGEFDYEVFSATGQPITKGKLADPSIRRYEFADPDRPGSMKAKEVKLNDVEFTLRLPHQNAAQIVKFFRPPLPALSPAKQNVERRLLGSVELPLREGGTR